jgi:hypothetical protein
MYEVVSIPPIPKGWLIALVVLAAIASPLIEGWLWRAGKVTSRTLAMLLVGHFPIVCFLFGLIATDSLPLALMIGAVSLPSVLLYRPIQTFLGEGPSS